MAWPQNHTKFFRALLYCYPAEFRHEYGVEMEQIFADRLQSEPGWRLWLETLADVALSAPREHWAILSSDLKHESRALLAMPGFTAIVLLVTALGIGATVSVFSVVNAVLLRSLPYGHPENLVYLWSPNVNFKGVPDEMGPNVADVYDWRRLSKSFTNIAAFGQRSFNLVLNGSTRRIGGALVTASFFETLEVTPRLGRPLDITDDQPGHEHVVVISDQFWRDELHEKPDVIGTEIQLNREKYTVVGVMPKDFGYPFDGDIPHDRTGFAQADIWMPAAYSPGQRTDRRANAYAIAIGRLKKGVSLRAAQSELRTIEDGLQPLYEPMWRGWSVLLTPLVTTIVGPVQQMMWILLASVGLVLVIAISNVAGLLLARVSVRGHELGIRTALGANRARIIRQLLTESLLLSCVGGLLGIGLAYALVHILVSLNPGRIPRFDAAAVDPQALIVATALSIATGLLAGFTPALAASKPNISDLLKRGGSRIARGSHRSRFALIVLEVALSVALLTGAGLLVRSYLLLQSVDPGFSPSSLTFSVELDDKYKTAEAQNNFYREFLGKLKTVGGFRYVGATSVLPLGGESVTSVEIKGFGPAPELVEFRAVTPEYRKALGTLLLRGRDFDLHDVNPQPNVVIVNSKFVDAYFQGRDPLGGQIRFGIGQSPKASWNTIVGVVGDIHHDGPGEAAKPQMFQPTDAANNFAIRAAMPAPAAASQVRSVLRTMDPALTLDIKTMSERIKESNARQTFQTWLLTGFALSALLLALVGLYGLMSYTVRQRTSEIGIRLAIGSPRSQVLCLILWQGMRLTAIGLAIGLAAAFALTHFLGSWLFETKTLDPITFTLTPLTILAVAACACLIPAWSATRIDPIQTLRQE